MPRHTPLAARVQATQLRLGAAWPWLVSLCGALTLATGFVLVRDVERSQRTGLAEELMTLRDLNAAALREWLTALKAATGTVAEDEHVSSLALALVDASAAADADELRDLPAQSALEERLRTFLRLWRLDDYAVISGERIVAAADAAEVGVHVDPRTLPVAATQGEAALDLPHAPEPGSLQTAEPVMWSVAPVRGAGGEIRALLAFRVAPERNFSRLLRTSQFGESVETYAIDRDGVLVSSTRFDASRPDGETLRESDAGLSRMRARPRDDGGGLTKAAASAALGGSGVDVLGYPDYRGVEVVAAWTWLDEHGIGLVTKVDRSEAYRSSAVILRATRTLTGIVVAYVALFGFGFVALRRLQRRLRADQRLGRYTLIEKLGEGGMGVVYVARHALLRRPTALKVLGTRSSSPTARARFEREVQAMASLRHPNTLAVYDYGLTVDGVAYYAMELVDGTDLAHVVRAGGALPPARVVHFLVQIAGSLAEAHAAGLVHRDIKPGNVLVCAVGRLADHVKVADFGLVKQLTAGAPHLTSSKVAVGTPLYMAPEAIRTPAEVDHRVDLYAVGCIAHELLTGRPPFDAPRSAELMRRHVEDAVGPLDPQLAVPPALEALMRELLAKNPADRPPSADALVERLEALRAELPRWTSEDARAWWDEHPPRRPASMMGPLPLAVDVAAR